MQTRSSESKMRALTLTIGALVASVISFWDIISRELVSRYNVELSPVPDNDITALAILGSLLVALFIHTSPKKTTSSRIGKVQICTGPGQEDDIENRPGDIADEVDEFYHGMRRYIPTKGAPTDP